MVNSQSPVQPSRLGDMLKHAWLAETVSALLRVRRGQTFRFADPFGGTGEQTLAPEVRERLGRARGLGYLALQRADLKEGKYLGSTVLVRRLCALEKAPHEILSADPDRDAWDWLHAAEGLDLILIDFPAAVAARAGGTGLPERLRGLSARSTLLLFTLHGVNNPDAFAAFLRGWDREFQPDDFLHGRLPPHPQHASESLAWPEIFLVPAADLPEEAVRALFGALRSVTRMLWDFLASELSIRGGR